MQIIENYGLHIFYEVLIVFNFVLSVFVSVLVLNVFRKEKDPIRWGVFSLIIPSVYFAFFYGVLFFLDLDDFVNAEDQFIHLFSRPGITVMMISIGAFLLIMRERFKSIKEKEEELRKFLDDFMKKEQE